MTAASDLTLSPVRGGVSEVDRLSLPCLVQPGDRLPLTLGRRRYYSLPTQQSQLPWSSQSHDCPPGGVSAMTGVRYCDTFVTVL